MNQHITVDQLNELSDKGKERLKDWWEKVGDLTWSLSWGKENGYCLQIRKDGTIEAFLEDKEAPYESVLPLLSIGQMIEFLEDRYDFFELERSYHGPDDEDNESTIAYRLIIPVSGKSDLEYIAYYLVDTLWEAVKGALEE